MNILLAFKNVTPENLTFLSDSGLLFSLLVFCSVDITSYFISSSSSL
jgi:hypothetical protein